MNLRSSGKGLFCILGPLLALGCSQAPGSTDGTVPPVGGSGGGSTAAAGTNATGTGGMTGTTGAAGSGGAIIPVGTAGSSVGGATVGGASSAGATSGGAAGTTGVAGSAPMAGAAGSGGSGGMAQVGMYNVPRGMSAGCGKLPPGEDGQTYVKHDIAVTGVDPAFIAAHPSDPANNGGYTYLKRNYFLKLPAGYDGTKPFALTFGGGGCGNTGGDSGRGGGQQASGIPAIQVGLSYVYSGGACFEDGYANTPEVPYFDAVMADISAKYCVNLEKVFVGGYSSGAWEAVTLGLARGGVIRGIATGAGGLRMNRPPPSGIPMAAILLTGQGDGTNPIDGPTGSALARDQILMTNKCTGTATMPFAGDADCVQYTGCPAAFPVVWCTPPGGHTGGSGAHWAAVGAFWNALPPVP
ncbi:MAG TPA: hypothetical protein VNG33_03325 [Polyangiaceae bacterium]|nr:hypothetical protein [Polyangiaceae bacterium]